jgi:hypothetical protein
MHSVFSGLPVLLLLVNTVLFTDDHQPEADQSKRLDALRMEHDRERAVVEAVKARPSK